MTVEQTAVDEDRQDALHSAAWHAARLIHAYGWLRVLVEPGREPRPAPPLLSDAQLRHMGVTAAAEARDRAANLRAGLTAGPSGPVPIRLVMVTAQIRVVRAVAGLTARAVDAGATPFGPVTERSVPHALGWLAGDGGPSCWVSTPAGDVYRSAVLNDLPTWLVEETADRLHDVADRARATAGITTERVAPYPNQPCPACRRRSLQIDATLANERYWTVACLSDGCRCAGMGCPCLRHGAIEGRRHAWTYAELPRLALAQQRHRRTHRVGSGSAGHGRWTGRRGGDDR